jgi:hypothetical protein
VVEKSLMTWTTHGPLNTSPTRVPSAGAKLDAKRLVSSDGEAKYTNVHQACH